MVYETEKHHNFRIVSDFGVPVLEWYMKGKTSPLHLQSTFLETWKENNNNNNNVEIFLLKNVLLPT